jgi:hypothetical protein
MDADSLENLYYAIAAVVVAILTVHGWRQGVGRQFMTLLAIAGAYIVGFFGAGAVAPWFTFLRYPAPVTRIIGGVAGGLLTLIAITTLGRFFFKRTSEKETGKGRWSYGFFGAVLGLVFGVAVFFVASEMVRLVGALAQSNVQATEQAAANSGKAGPDVNPVVSGLAKLSSALNEGGSGDLFRKVDPVPVHVFSTLTKLGLMVSRPDAVERFLAYPGIDNLSRHPKLLALRSDPEVERLLASQSYFRLLRHEKVIALANDPEFADQIKRTDFNEALDYALKPKVRRKPSGLQIEQGPPVDPENTP